MEQELKIKTSDGKIIYGILRGSLKKPLIVLVHGLGSTIIEALEYNASRYFEKHGFSTFLISLYSWNKGHRKMVDSTLATHGKDIDTAIRFLRKRGAKKIFIIGHSYGAPSILYSKDQDFKAAVFWDGTILSPKSPLHWGKTRYVRAVKGRVLDWGFSIVLGEKMYQESLDVNSEELIKGMSVPIKFVCAGKGILVKKTKKLFGKIKNSKEFAVIKGASHNFEEDEKQEQLYRETVSWFKKFI